jgi:hypothetical protein
MQQSVLLTPLYEFLPRLAFPVATAKQQRIIVCANSQREHLQNQGSQLAPHTVNQLPRKHELPWSSSGGLFSHLDVRRRAEIGVSSKDVDKGTDEDDLEGADSSGLRPQEDH